MEFLIHKAWAILNMQHRHLSQLIKLEFKKGDKVKFNAKSRGLQTGVVTKINSKTIAVKADTGVTWKVSPNLLQKVA